MSKETETMIKHTAKRSLLRHAPLLALLLGASTLFGPAGAASAAAPPEGEFGVAATEVRVTDAEGNPYTQAAGHPADIATMIELKHHTDTDPAAIGALIGGENQVADGGDPKDVGDELPPGFVGNPTSMQQCTQAQLSGGGRGNGLGLGDNSTCPLDSQIGTITLSTQFAPSTFFGVPTFPLFNMVPGVNEPASFGFQFLGTPVRLGATVRSDGDYGVTVASTDIATAFHFWKFETVFWGNPPDPVHDIQRCNASEGMYPENWCGGGGNPSELPPNSGFLRMPTSCTAPEEALPFTAVADSWFDPGNFSRLTVFAPHEPPYFPEPGGPQVGITGCEEIPFQPRMRAVPTTYQADSPTGLELELTVPQQTISEPEARAQSDLRKSVVQLPEGMVINPASAGGLAGCSAAQIGLITPVGSKPIHFTDEDPSCPEPSKIGQVEITSPLLEEPMKGSVFLAKQSENPFGSLLAMYVYAKGQNVIVKLPVLLETDPATGRLTAVADELPQQPFETFKLTLKSGQRAPLINPPSCGTQEITATLTPWSGTAPVPRTSPFQLTSNASGLPCVNSEAESPFAPRFSEGSVNPEGGATSTFVLHLARGDGEQRFARLQTALPEGVTAYLKGVPYCPEPALAAAHVAATSGAAELAGPSCPAASRLGTVTAAAGAGTIPFITQGKVYLAGPYEGAPLSFAVFVPALAGPFDLGDVLVRVPVHLDPETAQASVSNSFPTILQGIPLDLQSVSVAIDRPNFVQNPTNCDSMTPQGTLTSTLGKTISLQARYQLVDCAKLAFKPQLAISLSGKTNRGAHPALRSVLTMKPGEANIARASVALPHGEFLDQGHIKNVCTRVQFAAGGCPASSVLGYARAITPLLDNPLQGPVYLMSGFGHKLPDVAADLNGQIRVLLHGKVDTAPSGGIRTTFEVVPDAPVSKFTLSLKGGQRGLIQNSEDICAHPQRATVLFDAQNGKTYDSAKPLSFKCGKPKTQRRQRGR